MCALSFSHKKNPLHPFILSSLSLSHISLSLVQSMPLEFTTWRGRHCRSQRGEIGTWRVAWSRWWRCGFGSMIDGGDVGRSRWWFNLSLWCGLVLVCVGLLGLGWFGLWVDLGMCGGVEMMAFWSALIFLCVGWSVLVDLMLIFLWFWVEIGWVLMEFWSACLEIGF